MWASLSTILKSATKALVQLFQAVETTANAVNDVAKVGEETAKTWRIEHAIETAKRREKLGLDDNEIAEIIMTNKELFKLLDEEELEEQNQSSSEDE